MRTDRAVLSDTKGDVWHQAAGRNRCVTSAGSPAHSQVRQSTKWVSGAGVSAPDATAADVPSFSDTLGTEDVPHTTRDDGDDEQIEGTPSLFDEGPSIIMETQQSAISEEELNLVIHTQVSDWAQSTPGVSESTQSELMGLMEPSLGETQAEDARRGIKSRSSRSPKRTCAADRGVEGTRVREIAAATSISTESKMCFSCPADECKLAFKSYKEFRRHASEEHSIMTVKRYSCPLKICSVTCNEPAEWLSHIASHHPDRNISKKFEIEKEYWNQEKM